MTDKPFHWKKKIQRFIWRLVVPNQPIKAKQPWQAEALKVEYSTCLHVSRLLSTFVGAFREELLP